MNIFSLTAGVHKLFFKVKETMMRDIWFSRIDKLVERRVETIADTLHTFEVERRISFDSRCG
jgi:hypothetical protein